jgi:hypothetical protein
MIPTWTHTQGGGESCLDQIYQEWLEDKNKKGITMSETFTITRDWLLSVCDSGAKKPNGEPVYTCTKDAMTAIGEPWLVKGWTHSIVGKVITLAQKERFEKQLSVKEAKRAGGILLQNLPVK